MEQYLCIHGHFYQPPRENPWLEAIETEASASPYHDWNERITVECYAPNGAAHILDAEGRSIQIASNYAKMSFNFGPTLLSWMAQKRPDIYQTVLDADKAGQAQFSGHSSAIAQAYNHVIMPLANRRDKETQVAWGIYDFEKRFGRKPEGMWLPETAVDLESLAIMAGHGIQFTILDTAQAKRFRPIGGREWRDATDGRLDPTMPYLVRLREGRTIAVFFYDGPVSRAVAFERLLSDGAAFASRLLASFNDGRPWPQIVSIATDGETYGHHFRHGDMALAYALHHIETRGLARLTNYAEYLERYPPSHEVELRENTSWSCPHGVERWRSDCGCNMGAHPEWRQAWRAPLREAIDWLRDSLATHYEQEAAKVLADPWLARDEYISVILDRSPANVSACLASHATVEVTPGSTTSILNYLELQRHSLLMQTSCGWFFDDISGIEAIQVLRYAGRAMQLAREVFAVDLEAEFRDRLRKAPVNDTQYRDGADVYDQRVKPAMVG